MRLGSQVYTNHSVVDVGHISVTALQCQGARHCCGTEGHWYYHDGTPVRNFMAGGTTLYMTRGGDNQDSLYLHRDSPAQAVALDCTLLKNGIHMQKVISSTNITIHFTHRKANCGFPDISPGLSQY